MTKNTRWLMAGVVSTLMVVAALTGFARAERPATPPGLAHAIAAQEKHTDALLARQGVVGTAVGLDANGVPVVKIYTEAAEHAAGLPHSLDGVATDVEVTGKLVAQNVVSNTGVSSGSERLIQIKNKLYCTTGTLGAVVSDGTNLYALSNAHVYALQGSKPYGGPVATGSTGDRALVPGRVDMTECGTQSQINAAAIGTLWDYKTITISRIASNTVDAAIARLTDTPSSTAVPPLCGSYVPGTTPVDATLNLAVKKCGRTTSLTTGTVTGLNATILISYDTGTARFVGQIVVTGNQFSQGGDSGSLIVTGNTNAPVALLFAGGGSTTIGNPINLVLDAFGVQMQ